MHKYEQGTLYEIKSNWYTNEGDGISNAMIKVFKIFFYILFILKIIILIFGIQIQQLQ